VRSRDAVFEFGSVGQILVDRSGYLKMANEKARSLFGLSETDVGRPFRDLDMSYRPIELRSRLEKVADSRQPDLIPDVALPTRSGEAIHIQIEIVPLVDAGSYLGAVVTFEDVTGYRELQEELERSNQELETAMEELQSTNEELETTNEELQSTNEELETTN
jgi:two-component system, chemotaxis family, CheB/CheR fusion protein